MIRSKLFAICLFLAPVALIAAATYALGALPAAAPTLVAFSAALVALALTPIGDTVAGWAIRQLARAAFGIDYPFVWGADFRAPQTGRPQLTSHA